MVPPSYVIPNYIMLCDWSLTTNLKFLHISTRALAARVDTLAHTKLLCDFMILGVDHLLCNLFSNLFIMNTFVDPVALHYS